MEALAQSFGHRFFRRPQPQRPLIVLAADTLASMARSSSRNAELLIMAGGAVQGLDVDADTRSRIERRHRRRNSVAMGDGDGGLHAQTLHPFAAHFRLAVRIIGDFDIGRASTTPCCFQHQFPHRVFGRAAAQQPFVFALGDAFLRFPIGALRRVERQVSQRFEPDAMRRFQEVRWKDRQSCGTQPAFRRPNRQRLRPGSGNIGIAGRNAQCRNRGGCGNRRVSQPSSR